jgi:two-component system response regulator AtoC
MGLAQPDITQKALRTLSSYSWPGNVRELQNAVQFALLACRGEPIDIQDLPVTVVGAPGQDRLASSDPDRVDLRDPLTGDLRTLQDIEREVLAKARDLTGGNMSRTAQLLGIGRATLYRKIPQES